MLSLIARPTMRADVSWSAYDPRWYTDIGGMTSGAGPVVVPEAALGIAAVYRAVNVLAHSIASVPLIVYRRDGEDQEPDRGHAAYDVLHDKPNSWMTSFRWRHLLMTQAVLWGNHYSEIKPGQGGIGALVPLNPDTTRIVDQTSDGRLIYVTRDYGRNGSSEERRLVQDEVLHVRGFSIDGKSGIPLTKTARNAMGLAIAAERHGSMFMRNGARLAGLLTTEAPMKDPERKELERAWQTQYGGTSGTGKTPLLTGGVKYQPVSSNNKESQWLEARNFQTEEVLRFMGVDPVLVGHPAQTQAFASVEQLFLKFVQYSVMPWAVNIAQELNASVITGGPDSFVAFKLEGLLRGDIKTRYEAHRLAISAGFKNRNEARVEEGYNRGPEELDVYLEPLNMVEAGAERDDAPPPSRAPAPPTDSRAAAVHSRMSAIVGKSVERIVHREVAAISGTNGRKGTAARYADDPAGWKAWLGTFYDEHAVRISEDLDISLVLAERYCAGQRERFATVANIEIAEAESVAALLRLTPAERISA